MNVLIKEEKKEEIQTALGVTVGQEAKASEVLNEEILFSSRSGRKGGTQKAKTPDQGSSKVSSSSQGEVHRVVISKESNKTLESILCRCAEGFESGTITKSDIANYIFQNVNKFFLDSDIKSLRAAHFNEKKMLSTILRTDADLPEELRKAIRAHFGINEKEKKRTTRAQAELSTEKTVDN